MAEPIEVDANTFGRTGVAGMQQKGAVEINNQIKYIKLDTLTPKENGQWEDRFDYRYSSVSEAMVSCLTNNIKNPVGRTVNYQFETFKVGDKLVSGTISDSYLDESEAEITLGFRGDREHGAFKTVDEFADKVVDTDPETRLTNLVKRFEMAGVKSEVAEQFLIQQAGFDVLVGNNDRLENPGNFVVSHKLNADESIPVNMDYGRCLQMPTWSDTMEERLDITDDELVAELNEDNADDLLSQSKSITGSKRHTESLEFIKQHNFEPFQIDVEQFKADLHALVEKIDRSDFAFKKFARMKANAFETVLDREDIQDLFVDVSQSQTINNDDKVELNFEGINVNQTKGLE